MTHVADRFEPIAANQTIYDQLYNKVYKTMYGRLKPSYLAIQSITGR
jgi:hypothetical protein